MSNTTNIEGDNSILYEILTGGEQGNPRFLALRKLSGRSTTNSHFVIEVPKNQWGPEPGSDWIVKCNIAQKDTKLKITPDGKIFEYQEIERIVHEPDWVRWS